MFHGLTPEVLYCVGHFRSVFRDDLGHEVEKSGTAFSLMIGTKHAIVTNAHLLDCNYGETDSKYARYEWHASYFDIMGKDEEGLPTSPKSFMVPGSHNTILRHNNELYDVATIFDPQASNLDGSDYRHFDFCFGIESVATEYELYEELQPFDVLAFPGFPFGHSTNGPRAIIRGGTVASDPRFTYEHAQIEGKEAILYEAFSMGGSSGSPVFAVPKVPPVGVDPNPANKFRRLLLVGVNAGHLVQPATGEHSGLSYFVKSNIIREILQQQIEEYSAGPSPAI